MKLLVEILGEIIDSDTPMTHGGLFFRVLYTFKNPFNLRAGDNSDRLGSGLPVGF